MVGRLLRHLLLALAMGALVAACSNVPSASAPPVSPTAVSPAVTQAPVVASPVAPAAPTAVQPGDALAPAPTAVTALERGRTPEGYHYLGSADAPITLQEYSDFF